MSENALKDLAKKLPQRPGVYLYHDSKRQVLYVGKAISLKDRVMSYFQKDIAGKTQILMQNAASLTYIETGSEIEALFLEAALIKKHLPKYNIILKDDKSYLYVFISIYEDFPIVTLVRKSQINNLEEKIQIYRNLRGKYFGPFSSSQTARQLLKSIRKYFPFCQQLKIGFRTCFYSHIGLCDPCPSTVKKLPQKEYRLENKRYRKNLHLITDLFAGKMNSVKKNLHKLMLTSASTENYEVAGMYRNQLQFLENLPKYQNISAFLENSNYYLEKQDQFSVNLLNILRKYYPDLTRLKRIEGYDISNIQGKLATGSEVVFIDGIPEKSLYRRYHIRLQGSPDDPGMLQEIIARRFSHTDADLPELIIVDGGKSQVATIRKLLREIKIDIPLIGLSKRKEELILFYQGQFKQLRLSADDPALQLVQQIRDEAHRFALKYHRLQRKKAILQLQKKS